MPDVLVLTCSGDVHAEAVIERLCQRGADFAVIDPGDFPVTAVLSVSYSRSGLIERTLIGSAGRLDLGAIGSVWFRRPNVPEPHPEIDHPGARDCVREEIRALSRYMWDNLDCLAVPGTMRAIREASCKPAQLARAGRLGFELPPTIITTDPEEFLEFWGSHAGQVITKPLDGLSIGVDGEVSGRYSEIPTILDLAAADAVRFCPVIAQAYVPKDVELRVTVVGDRVFAVEIRSQRSNHARRDWRNYDAAPGMYALHSLPDETAERCIRLVTELDLNYGALDLILTPDGRYVFLEINPAGQWLWLESATGAPIADAVADLLLSTGDRSSRSLMNGALR